MTGSKTGEPFPQRKGLPGSVGRAAWAVSLLLFLGALAQDRVGLVWERRPVEVNAVSAGIGYPGHCAYSFKLGTTRASRSPGSEAVPAQLLEDGAPLSLPDALHADIAEKGEGRYSFWGENLFFSSSDCSDPRESGRRYEVLWPKPGGRFLALAAFVLALIITPLTAWPRRGPEVSRVAHARAGLLEDLILAGRAVRQAAAGRVGVAIWIVAVALALGLSLHEHFGFAWEKRHLTPGAMKKGIGYPGERAFEVALRTTWTDGEGSPAQLLEDGAPLPEPDSQHADIARLGAGRYALSGGRLLFSASDGSDPRSNGRIYELSWPVPVPEPVQNAIRALALGLTALLAGLHWLAPRLRGLSPSLPSSRACLLASCAIVFLAFALARLPWVLDFRLPGITYDTGHYFLPVEQLQKGMWPDFRDRTPGYPMFLAVALALVPKVMFVVVLQAAAAILSPLFFLYAVHRTCGRLVLLAAGGLLAHVTQPMLAQHDFMLMSESLFSSLFLAFLGCLFIGTHEPRRPPLLAASFLGAAAILVRPAGLYIAGTVALAAFYLVARRAGDRFVACLVLPMGACLLGVMVYNQYTVGIFGLSRIGNLARWSITATYWEADSSFPPHVNEAIRKVAAEIPDAERRVVLESWDLDKIQSIMAKWSAHVYYQCENVSPRFPGHGFIEPANVERMATKAIHAHPLAAFKVFLSTLSGFLTDQSAYRSNSYDDVLFLANQMYIEGTAGNPFVSREFLEFPPVRGLKLVADSEGRRSIRLNQPKLRGRVLFYPVRRACALLFDHRSWTLLWLLILVISVVRVVQTKMQHWGAFIVVATGSCLLSAALLVAGVAAVTNRYAAPTKFIEVLSVGLAPLLWRKEVKE